MAQRAPNIYLLMALTVFTHAAFSGSRVVVSLYALHLNASNLAIGSLMSLYALLPMLLAVSAGRITDRVGVRPPLMFAAVTVSLGLTIPYAWQTLAALYFAAALVGVGFMAFHVAINSAVGTISEPHRRTHNFSLLAMGFSTSAFLGPMAAGLAIDHTGYRNAFLILAVLPLVAVAFLMSKRLVLPGPHAGSVHRADHRLMDLLKNQALRNVFITSGMMSMGWDLFSFMVPIYGAREAGLSASMIGVILAVFASATFSVRLLMRFIIRHLREWQVLTMALAITASTYLLFPMFKNPYILMALSFYLGLGLGSAQPMVMTLLHNISPPGRVGEAVGVRTTVMNTSQTTMPLLLGAMGTAFGMLPVFWAMALLLGAGSWFASRSASRGKAAKPAAPSTQL
jgi:predicted MFS family arabinose efflux permease